MIRIAEIVNDSIVDGPGLRIAIFVQGCPHKCEGCHNPQTHAFDGGRDASSAEIIGIIDRSPLCMGVTFTGGEPMCQAETLLPVALHCKKRGLNTIIFSGYVFEEIITDEKKLGFLQVCDILIDGRYEIDKRSLSLKFRGSKNQRVIDIAASLERGAVVPPASESWRE